MEQVQPFAIDMPKPPADDDSDLKLVEFIRGLAQESARDRKNRIISDRSVEDWWQLGFRRFLGDHHDFQPRDGMLQFTLNRDQVAVVANVADQTLMPIRPQFRPIENDDEPIFFVSNRAAKLLLKFRQQQQQQLKTTGTSMPSPLDAFSDEQILGVEPIDAEQAKILRAMARPTLGPDGQLVDPPLDHKAVVMIDDKFRADLIQKVFDAKWTKAQGDSYVSDNELISNVFGHAILWFECHEDTWGFDFSNPHVMHVLVDPTGMQVPRDSAYVIIKELVGLDRAKELWPHLGPRLEKAKQEGHLNVREEEWTQGATSTEVDYRRPMVTILVAYLRDFSTPLSVESALEGGFVKPALDDDENELADDEGTPILMNTQTGALTTHGDDVWPSRTSMRVVKIIDQANYVVFNEPLAYKDFPIGWNKNIPIPFSPFGLGESQRLKDVQDAINWAGGIMINHLLYWQYPQEIWPKSLLDDFERTGVEAFAHPGQQVGIDDADFRDWVVTGKLQGFMIHPPAIPPSVVNFWAEMRQEHEIMSGYTGVRQGQAPTSDSSGELVKQLVAQAGGVVAYKARHTERMVEHVADVLTTYLVEHMPPDEWHKYCTDLTPQAFDVVWGGMDQLRYDVACEIGTGRGSEKQREDDKAIEDLDKGGISRRTFRIKRGVVDPDGEERQIAQERQLDAMRGGTVQQGGVQQQ